MKVPSNSRWTQLNTGNIEGVLNETHNITLSRVGEARLSRKAVALLSGNGDFEEGMAIVYYNGNYIAVTDDWAFEGDLSGGAFTAINGSNGLGPETDAIAFNGYLYVTKSTSLSRWNGTTWNNSLDSYTTGFPHPMCIFDSQPVYKLAVGNANQVETLDTSHNANTTVLTIPANYTITCLAYRNGYLYIGTKEINGGEAAIFIWNGDGAAAQYKVDVGAAWVYAMTPYRGSVAAVTNEGEVLFVSGSSVQQLAAFPVFSTAGARWDQGNAVRGKVYPRGMVAQGDSLYINIEGKCDSGFVSGMKSGVWCYEPKAGLYHMATATSDTWVVDNAITLASSVLTTSATHSLNTGDAVMFSAASGIAGVSSNVLYYAIPVAANTLKIAASLADAFDGNYMTLTGTPTTDTLHYIPNTDNGNEYSATSGAITLTNYLDSGKYKLWDTDILFCSSTKNPAGTTKNIICALTAQKNTGSFTTQRIYTDNVSQTWKSLYLFLNGLLESGEKAVVKYAIADKQPRLISGTWADSSTFNTTDAAARNVLAVGDEFVCVEGQGQGRTAHITAIAQSTGTVSLTLDEAIGSVGVAATGYFTKFKKIGEVTSTRAEPDIARVSANVNSSWVQFKVEMRGFEAGVAMLDVSNSLHSGVV